MKLQVIKQGNHYVIPVLEGCNINQNEFYVELDNDTASQLIQAPSNTVHQLSLLNESMGGDDYLEYKLKNLPADYCYITTQTDDELLGQALNDKYDR